MHHVEHLRRLVDHGVERLGHVLGADMADVDLGILHLGEEFRIGEGLAEGIAEDGDEDTGEDE